MVGTVSVADIYGGSPPGRRAGDVAPSSVQVASGKMPEATPNAPSMFWVGFVGLLVLLRVLWEMGE